MSEKLLEIKDLRIEYVTEGVAVQAVNGISFSIEAGQSMGLVGETGAGKTTTALSILRLLPKYTAKVRSGSITFAGEDIMSLSEAEMRKIRGGRVSMIFQDPMTSLDPVISVRDQIAEVLLLHKPELTRKTVSEEVGRILELVGIPASRMNEYPHQFSGGMKQRVMIAIAMICNPEILIADEPTTALDVTIQAQILELMKRLQKEHGTSIILITHNMGIVAENCDDVAVMYMGRVVEYGTLEQIFTNPLHPYTQALMRSVPVLGMDKSGELESIPGTTPDAATVFTGCEFANRCQRATEACFHRFPKDTVYPDGHRVRCLHYEEGK